MAAAVLLVASCNGIETSVGVNRNSQKVATGPETIYPDGARRITIDEFEALRKDGQVYIVDVRNQASYDLGHIPDSHLIPAGEIANHLDELPRDKTIVTYCS
jgi:predicted sulfurtransferase